MDKSRSDILSEIKDTLESLKEQVAGLEARIAAIEAEPQPDETTDMPDLEEDMSPIDISLDVDMEAGAFDDIPAAAPEPEPEPKPMPEPQPEAQPEPEPKPEPIPESEDDVFSMMPKESINDKQEKKSKKAVMDVMGTKCAWKTAMPGTPVKNVISAISLNDRVLFINTLFKEDPMAFQNTIAAFNGMSSFAEAEEYVNQNFPDWNLNSDIVYRLMMAVRRKLK